MNRRFAILFVLIPLVLFAKVTAAQKKTPHKPKSSGSSCGTHCGTERWGIKTLTDSGSAAVTAATPTSSTVSKLTSEQAPAHLPQSSRVAPIENQQFTIQAVLIAWKEEAGAKGDHDFHLVLADPKDHTKTMIAEVPSPQCASACASGSVESFKTARQVLTTELGPAPQVTSAVPVVPPRIIEVTGVGFFDYNHGQDGLAWNCIEIHPVLKITFQGQEGSSVIPFQKTANHKCGAPSNPHGGGGKAKTPNS